MIKYASDIMSRIEHLDAALRKHAGKLTGRAAVILAGGAAIMLKYAGKRWTQDIDVLQNNSLKGIGSLLTEAGGMHLTSDSIVHLHPDYAERLVKVKTMAHVDLYALSPIDIAISKTARGSKKDFYDIYSSDIAAALDTKEFQSLFTEAMQYWIGDEGRFLDYMHETINLIKEKQSLSRHKIIDKAQEALDLIATHGMISDTPEVLALNRLLSDAPETGGPPSIEICSASAYVIENAGESLSDSESEVLLADIIRAHNRRIGISKRESPVDFTKVDAGKLMKLFKTLAYETLKDLTEDQRQDLDSSFGSPGIR